MNALRCILFLALVAAVGCGGGKVKLQSASVQGTVVYQGKPLGKGHIIFFHESGQAKATDLATDGTFKLTAFQGKNRIAVECYEPEKANPNSYGRATLSLGKSLIPHRYTEAGTSGLSHDVTPGDNKVTFTLTQ
jgi:hypothetical protein